MWYLAYLDDAMTAFLLEGGLPYSRMLDRGCDVQLVHTELDWKGSLTWSGAASVLVGLADVGRTSFTLQFEFRSADQAVATGIMWFVSLCAFVPVIFSNLVAWLRSDEDPDDALFRLIRDGRRRAQW